MGRIKKMSKKIASLVLLTFLISACSLYRLERKLPDDIKAWYKIHVFLMESKVPIWLDARFDKEISERRHFLTLSEDWQRAYMKYFWRIRTEGLKWAFEERMAAANQAFREGRPGWQTDRGKIFIKFGVPQFAQSYMERSGYADRDIDGYAVLVWGYYFGSNIVQYVFRFVSPNSWRADFSNRLATMGAQMEHHRWFVETWGPTQEGWETWGSYLYSQQRKE